MGSSKSSTSQNYNQNQSQTTNQRSSEQFNQGSSGYQQTTFNPQSDAERDILDQYRGLGENQIGFLNGIMGDGYSPFTLNEADQSTLDKAYQSAMDRYRREGLDYADYLSSTRGLNKSDTPVSGDAMNRYGMGLADLESQKANAALNLGLQGAQFRLQGAQALPAGLGAAFMPMFNERMAGGRTETGQNAYGSSSGNFYNSSFGNSNGNSTTTQRYTPSIMSQIGQGMGLATQAIGLGAQIGGMAMGVPPVGAMMGSGGGGGGNPFLTSMGGGTSSNSWFGPGNYNTGGMSGFFK